MIVCKPIMPCTTPRSPPPTARPISPKKLPAIVLTSTTVSRPGSYSANDNAPNAARNHPLTGAPTSPKAPPRKTPQRFIRLPLTRRMNLFLFPLRTPRAHSLPTACPKATTLEHDRRNHRPKALPFSLLETPQNHPFARPAKAASDNSYSKLAISYNAPPKVLPLTGACLPLHCHQDSNEIQIKK